MMSFMVIHDLVDLRRHEENAAVNVTVVVDYGSGPGGGSTKSVERRLYNYLPPGSTVTVSDAVPLNELHSGYWIARYAREDERAFAERERLSEHTSASLPGARSIIYCPTDPRQEHDDVARENSRGSPLVYIRLRSGVEILAVNSGHNLSFLKEFLHIEECRLVKCASDGDQNRGLDVFPQEVALIAHGIRTNLGEDFDLSLIPKLPEGVVVDVDDTYLLSVTAGKGTLASIPQGAEVKVKLTPPEGQRGNLYQRLRGRSTNVDAVGAGLFEVPRGVCSLDKGSAGKINGEEGVDRTLELIQIAVRDRDPRNAARKLGHPEVGTRVEILLPREHPKMRAIRA